jgi:hypothetical protein
MKFLSLFICFFLFQAKASDLLTRHCQEIGGQMHDSYTCPKSGLTIRWDFCVSKSSQGITLFTDGCTGPSGGHTELFYPACIQHDYCYHHEPVTSGMNRRDCDQEFLQTTLKLCQQSENPNVCEMWAYSMYSALRGFGELAFNCAKYPADYR